MVVFMNCGDIDMINLEPTTIRVSKDTQLRLAALGEFGESYEDIIIRLIYAEEEGVE